MSHHMRCPPALGNGNALAGGWQQQVAPWLMRECAPRRASGDWHLAHVTVVEEQREHFADGYGSTGSM